MPDRTPPKRDFNWARFSKTLSFWVLIILIPILFVQLSGARQQPALPITYTRYRQELARDNISEVTVQAGKTIVGKFKDRIHWKGREVSGFTTHLPVQNSD